MDYDDGRLVYKQTLENGQKVVKILNVADRKTMHKIKFPRRAKDYWGFQLRQNKLVYVTNQNNMKIYDLISDKVISKLTGHRSYILAFEFENNKIVSLGSDHKIRVWDSNGQPTHNIQKIPGSFVPGYLYKVSMCNNNIFYTSDDGIYAFAIN